jgi:hypothetical protein
MYDNVEGVMPDDQDTQADVVEQAPADGEGQAEKPQGPVFTALDESEEEDIITGELDDDDEASDDEQEEAPEQEESAEPEVADPEPGKRVQTPEENAYFAELRRQREAAQRQAEMMRQLELMRQSMPETQIAQILSQQYGVSPQEILHRLQEAQLEQEAQQLGITPQQLRYQKQQEAYLRQQQQIIAQQQQFVQMQSLLNRLQAEGAEVRQKYPTITPDDLTEAVIFMYEHNAMHLPLEHAVRAKFADKLFAADREAAKQEALAKVSGRINNGIKAPQGKAPSSAVTLTPEERYFARKFGMTDEEYVRYKTE